MHDGGRAEGKLRENGTTEGRLTPAEIGSPFYVAVLPLPNTFAAGPLWVRCIR